MQDERVVPWLVAAVLISVAGGPLAAPGPTSTVPISYSTTFTDPSGTQKPVSFSGTAAGTSLAGTVTVDGEVRQVSGTIAPDGSVSGKFLAADGKQLGVFWGRPSGKNSMAGSYDLNGQVGDWSVPLKVPVSAITDSQPAGQ